MSAVPRGAHAGAQTTPQIHTLDEAAEILRVKRSWLERRAAARKIPFTMLGGAYHFTSEHLIEIVSIHERTPDALGSAPASRQSLGRPARHRLSESHGIKPLRARPKPGPQSDSQRGG
ncbi:MAG TPA: helix-turn-helix domain-containing protein [Streptosporangiaceae bacterium]|nr:helix-turn-helix domain-containing protein [Streptosporangiaceae bacterium]